MGQYAYASTAVRNAAAYKLIKDSGDTGVSYEELRTLSLHGTPTPMLFGLD